MRLQPWIASILVAFGVASCGENNPPPTQTRMNLSTAAGQNSPPAGRALSPTRAAASNAPVPPKDAQWTILCDTISGPAHVEDAGLFKSRLIQTSGMPDWYVVHGDKDSTLYYGYYGSMDNPAEKARAERDRSKIAAMTDNLGNRLVRGGVLVRINPPDPQAPPEWNLLNAGKDAYWTIEVATFSGNPKRKEAAVQAVRELRAKGEKEAYYYHGPTASSVCIGAWPREAVLEQGTGVDKQGMARDDAHTDSPDEPLLVLGNDVLPPNMPSRVYDPKTGKPMAVMGLRLQIQDPDMKAKAAEYPYHYVNYELHGVQNGGQTFPDPSVLVVIPRDQSTAGDDGWLLGGAASSPAPSPARQPAPSSGGDSVLRSIGDH